MIDMNQNQNPGFMVLLNIIATQVKTSMAPIYARIINNHIENMLRINLGRYIILPPTSFPHHHLRILGLHRAT